jgi:hypothetical protein
MAPSTGGTRKNFHQRLFTGTVFTVDLSLVKIKIYVLSGTSKGVRKVAQEPVGFYREAVRGQ